MWVKGTFLRRGEGKANGIRGCSGQATQRAAKGFKSDSEGSGSPRVGIRVTVVSLGVWFYGEGGWAQGGRGIRSWT